MASATVTVATYTQALERAQRVGVKVVGTSQSPTKLTWHVSTSRDPECVHGFVTVTLLKDEKELTCNCEFSKNGGYCGHRAVVAHALRTRADAANEAVPAAPALPTHEPVPTLLDGTYTIVRPDGTHRTLKARTQGDDASFAPGCQILKYLAKSNNDDEGSYVPFALIGDHGLRLYKKFRSNLELLADAETLVRDPSEAGERYAIASGHCYHCGRKLTVPASINRGLGPDCAKLLG